MWSQTYDRNWQDLLVIQDDLSRSIIGTLLGALIVGVFRNGLALSGVDVLWQDFAVGLLSM